MSEDNVEIADRAYDAFKRRDLDAFLALCDPDVEFVSYLVRVEGGGPHRGHDGVRSWWDRLLDVYPDFSFEVEETRDVGDLMIARIRIHGHGVESDAPMEQAVWLTAELSHGRIIWWRFVPSEAEALEAARSRE